MRKSNEMRMADTLHAIKLWEAAGFGADKRVAFMRDAHVRMGRGKGLTTKQRAWLDTLTTEQPPTPKGDAALLARLDAAMAQAFITPRSKEALASFKFTLLKGYNLSDAQEKFMNSILAQTEDAIKNGPWTPSEKQLREATFALSIIKKRGTNWQQMHPGTMNSAKRVNEWINTRNTDRAAAVLITEWDLDKIISAVKPAVNEFNNPKFAEGDMVWIKPSLTPWVGAGSPNKQPGNTFALITGTPVAFGGGRVGYPVLMSGMTYVIETTDIKKNAPKVK